MKMTYKRMLFLHTAFTWLGAIFVLVSYAFKMQGWPDIFVWILLIIGVLWLVADFIICRCPVCTKHFENKYDFERCPRCNVWLKNKFDTWNLSLWKRNTN